jgi:hypothetical protein
LLFCIGECQRKKRRELKKPYVNSTRSVTCMCVCFFLSANILLIIEKVKTSINGIKSIDINKIQVVFATSNLGWV